MENENLEEQVSDPENNPFWHYLSYKDTFLGSLLVGGVYFPTSVAYDIGNLIVQRYSEAFGYIGSEVIRYGLPTLAFLGMSTLVGAAGNAER